MSHQEEMKAGELISLQVGGSPAPYQFTDEVGGSGGSPFNDTIDYQVVSLKIWSDDPQFNIVALQLDSSSTQHSRYGGNKYGSIIPQGTLHTVTDLQQNQIVEITVYYDALVQGLVITQNDGSVTTVGKQIGNTRTFKPQGKLIALKGKCGAGIDQISFAFQGDSPLPYDVQGKNLAEAQKFLVRDLKRFIPFTYIQLYQTLDALSVTNPTEVTFAELLSKSNDEIFALVSQLQQTVSDFMLPFSTLKSIQLCSFYLNINNQITLNQMFDNKFITLQDVHSQRLKFLEIITDKQDAYLILNYVHLNVRSFSKIQKYINCNVTFDDYIQFKEIFFEMRGSEIVQKYSIEDGFKKSFDFVQDYGNNMTVAQFLALNISDLQKGNIQNLDLEKLDESAGLYKFFVELFIQLKDGALNGQVQKNTEYLQESIIGLIPLLEPQCQRVLQMLNILTKQQFLKLDVRNMFSQNQETILLQAQNTVRKNLSMLVSTQGTEGELFNIFFTQSLFNDQEDISQLIKDLTYFFLDGPSKKLLKDLQPTQEGLSYVAGENLKYMDQQITYAHSDEANKNQTITPRSYFKKLGDLICILGISQQQVDTKIKINGIQAKINEYLKSPQTEAIMQWLQTIKYRLKLQKYYKETLNKQFVFNDDNLDNNPRINFEMFLQRPDIKLALPPDYDKNFKLKCTELVYLLNALSFNKNIDLTKSLKFVNTLMYNSISNNPLFEGDIQKQMENDNDSAKNTIISIINDLFDNIKKNPAQYFKVQQSTEEVNIMITDFKTLMVQQLATLKGRMCISVVPILSSCIDFIIERNSWPLIKNLVLIEVAKIIGKTIFAIAIFYYISTLMDFQEWDWKEILTAIGFGIGIIIGLVQLLSFYKSSAAAFAKWTKIASKAGNILLNIIVIVYSALSILDGIKLMFYGEVKKGFLIITISLLQILGCVLNMIGFYTGNLILSITGGILGFIAAELAEKLDDVLSAENEFYKLYPYLGVWNNDILVGHIYPSDLEPDSLKLAQDFVFYLQEIDIQNTQMKDGPSMSKSKILCYRPMTATEKKIDEANYYERYLDEAHLRQIKFKDYIYRNLLVDIGQISIKSIQSYYCVVINKQSNPQPNIFLAGDNQLTPRDFAIADKDVDNLEFSIEYVGDMIDYGYIKCEAKAI